MDWNVREIHLSDDLSELLQHECDHLDGVLAVARAIDARSFAFRSQRSDHVGTTSFGGRDERQ
jgi:peptide deformylase